jgi:hypothetical protein
MRIQKLASTAGFLAIDLTDPPSAAGVVRSGPKILQSGAKDLARSLTYTFASFGMRRAGLSGGLDATPEARADAVAAMVAELADAVGAGRLSLDAGKGIDPSELATLNAMDARNPQRAEHAAAAHVAGVVAAAEAALGGLAGRTAAIEGFGATGPALVEALAGAGASVVTVATGAGSLSTTAGLDPGTVATTWAEHGDNLVAALAAADPEPAWKALIAPVDVLIVGSKTGVITHSNAERVAARAVVPHAPLPYTTRAMLMMERKGAVVVPDFLATAGTVLTDWADGQPSVTDAARRVAEAVRAAASHERGCFLGACFAAEQFLSTWQETLPFGRPLAP